MGIAGVAVIAALLAGCPKSESGGGDSGTGTGTGTGGNASGEAGASSNRADVGRLLVRNGCLSCHSEHMLAQQRLTQAQWQKTVTKMVGWGANIEPAEIGPLVAYLSELYGPDAGPYVAETIPAADAVAEIAATPDDRIPAGDVEHGKALYGEKCQGCHGPDARGAIGVALVDRPILYRAGEVAITVRRGRGKMIPVALSDAEIGHVLAYLRGLRNPPPP